MDLFSGVLPGARSGAGIERLKRREGLDALTHIQPLPVFLPS